MAQAVITYCNRAYAEKWFSDLRACGGVNYEILEAVIEDIVEKDGGAISKTDVFKRSPAIERLVIERGIEIIPSKGQMLRHNGRGIRHVKFSSSKNMALIWENIRGIVYVTFDDHAPVRYHRAISHLRDIRLGRRTFPKMPRITSKFLKKLKRFRNFRFAKDLRGFNARIKYYE